MSPLVCLWKLKSHLCLWKHLWLLISSGFVLLLSVTSLLCYSASHRSLIPSANTTWCADSNMYGCAVFSRWFKFTCNSFYCFPYRMSKVMNIYSASKSPSPSQHQAAFSQQWDKRCLFKSTTPNCLSFNFNIVFIFLSGRQNRKGSALRASQVSAPYLPSKAEPFQWWPAAYDQRWGSGKRLTGK